MHALRLRSASSERLPRAGVTPVRIKVEKVDEGQLQLTSWTRPKFKKGVKYVISGWIRSADNSHVKIGVWQTEDPRELFFEQGCKRLERGEAVHLSAHVMFIKQEIGTADLAGLEVREKK